LGPGRQRPCGQAASGGRRGLATGARPNLGQTDRPLDSRAGRTQDRYVGCREPVGLFSLFKLSAVGRRGPKLLQHQRPQARISLTQVGQQSVAGRRVYCAGLFQVSHYLLQGPGISVSGGSRRRGRRSTGRGRRR
jgi:hypothetical protein